MRKIATCLSLLLMAVSLRAQSPCNVDSSMNHSTNYPQTWHSGCVGVPYEETIYFAFPLDSNVLGVNVEFLSFEIIGDNLPAGLSYACNVSSCKWTPTNTYTTADHMLACFTISGIPQATFNGVVTFDIEGAGKAFGITQYKTEQANYNFKIFTPSSPGFTWSVSGTTASFTNTTVHGTSPSYSFNWQFGDGNTSSAASPTHTYANPGIYNACLTLSNSCGDSTICQTVITDGVGVEAEKWLSSWQVFPNPANEEIHLNGDLNRAGTVDWYLLGLQGNMVKRGFFQGLSGDFQHIIDLRGIPSGLYFLHFCHEGAFGVRKIIHP
ncbi:MAG: PKD domain-containing protein [Bacteroidia bacterium]|nr:PKD domain-containing protein [Bacteroidia bacterium]